MTVAVTISSTGHIQGRTLKKTDREEVELRERGKEDGWVLSRDPRRPATCGQKAAD